jgi:hypothetical protein
MAGKHKEYERTGSFFRMADARAGTYLALYPVGVGYVLGTGVLHTAVFFTFREASSGRAYSALTWGILEGGLITQLMIWAARRFGTGSNVT